MSEVKKSQSIIKTEPLSEEALKVYFKWGFFKDKKKESMTLFQNMKEQVEMNKEIKEVLFSRHDEDTSNKD